MSQVQYDVPPSEQRNRGTVAIRLILAIPHLILAALWSYVVQILAFIHWFVQVFTGKRNRGMFDFSDKWLGYSARTGGYLGLHFDEYPGFVDDQGKTPVRYRLDYEEPVNRLTAALRIIWAIPALIIQFFVSIALLVITVLAWFTIVFTGKLPQNWLGFMVKGHRYLLQVQAYTLLLTDEYPKFA